jgi:hypothetical protein
MVVLLSALLVPSALAWHEGENLLTPYELSTDEWEVFEKDKDGVYSMMWQRKGVGFADSFVVQVLHGADETVKKFRRVLDQPGRKSCGSFESEVLDESEVNGYPRLIWMTECDGDDGSVVARVVQVVIRGQDSLYHAQKLWRSEVSEEEMTLWRQRLASISVCDTRLAERACPDGYEQVTE